MNEAKCRLLVIDDEVKLPSRISRLLGQEGNYCELKGTGNGRQGLELLQMESFDLVITDLILPEVSGYDILDYINQNCPETLVIITTAYASSESATRILQSGAYDYIAKPVRPPILKLALRRALERIDLQRRLHKAKQKPPFPALIDNITTLYNIRYFNDCLKVEIERSRRYSLPLSCIKIGIDGFKDINDAIGYPGGDEILRCTAKIIQESIRISDLAARSGEDEFALLLPQTTLTSAFSLAERIKSNIEGYNFSVSTPNLANVSVSLGISTFPHAHVETPEDILIRADKALYSAKKENRNSIKSLEE